MATVYAQINHQNERDLLLMESIAIPLSLIVLVWVFGGLLAAALPMAVGLLAIAGSMAVLRAITFITDVSIFALNLSTALGLALAIDYTLLIVSRYRDELAEGSEPDEALIRTMTTSGRTVLFSAVTVALSMSATALFLMSQWLGGRHRHGDRPDPRVVCQGRVSVRRPDRPALHAVRQYRLHVQHRALRRQSAVLKRHDFCSARHHASGHRWSGTVLRKPVPTSEQSSNWGTDGECCKVLNFRCFDFVREFLQIWS